ncbi:MAG: winged helix-turn-helix domain-containing protein [Acidobacteria bacterium]|nr:winged helix-turn-helix domain-containing protein [Acidobacteriota bacterium]
MGRAFMALDRAALIYRFRGLEVWPSRRLVSRDGAAVYLRRHTFDLLLYLLTHRDRVVTKEELVSAVWDDLAVTDNSLVQCITEIRKALGDNPRQSTLIRTIPKVGYQLIAPFEEAEPETPAGPQAGPALAPGRRWGIRIAGAAVLLLLAGAGLWFLRDSILPQSDPRREVAWWTFDGASPAGWMPHGSPGQITGSVTRLAGVRGWAAQFTAPDSYLSGQRAARWPSGSDPRTVVGWVRAHPNGDHSPILHFGSRGPTPVAASFAVWANQEGRLAAGNKWSGGEAVGRTAVLDGTWHFVAAAYDGVAANRVRLYVDGRADGSAVLARAPATGSPADWAIGRFLESGTSLRGALDEVRLYQLALSEKQIGALFHCMASAPGELFALPVWPERPQPEFEGAGARIQLRNTGTDFAGIQFAAVGDCSLPSVRGSELGQDLEMRVTLLCPRDPHGYVTQAGPYFRSRSARPGEGLLGGNSAGYWIQLHSTGEIKVRSMNPMTVAAFSRAPAGFDDSAWHELRARAVGSRLQVWLDGSPVSFDQDRQQTDAVRLSEPWLTPPAHGENNGAGGISFACWDHRDCNGSQQARDIVFTRLHK